MTAIDKNFVDTYVVYSVPGKVYLNIPPFPVSGGKQPVWEYLLSLDASYNPTNIRILTVSTMWSK